jgi:Ni/Co efflux regulator RcnB
MRTNLLALCTVALLAAGMLAPTPALCDKPEWARGGEKGKPVRADRDARGSEKGKPPARADRVTRDIRARRGDARPQARHFHDQQRVVVRSYYETEFRSGKCPPGLAKKRNGCMPPGHAQKWHIGRPLPRDVIFYDIPPALVVQLGAPPAGHRYVRVASDILLIAIGTGLVLDAIEDLGRM